MKKFLFVLIICCFSVLNGFAQIETNYVIVDKNGYPKEENWRFTINTDKCTLTAENMLVTKHYNIVDSSEPFDADSVIIHKMICKEGDEIIHKITTISPKGNSNKQMFMLMDNMIVKGRDLGVIYYVADLRRDKVQ